MMMLPHNMHVASIAVSALIIAALGIWSLSPDKSPPLMRSRLLQDIAVQPPQLQAPKTQLLEDGTLLVRHTEQESNACSYFVNLPGIPRISQVTPSRIHYYFDTCDDIQLGKRLAEHFGHYLLANAAQVPFSMTCGNGSDYTGDHTAIRQMQLRNPGPGPKPVDATGHTYSVHDVCTVCYGLGWWCGHGPDLMTQIVQESMLKLTPNSALGQVIKAEDAVIHLRLGNAVTGGRDMGTGLLPFRSYVRLLKRYEQKNGNLETISVVTQSFVENRTRAEDLVGLERTRGIAVSFVKYIQEYFPRANVELRNSGLDNPLVSFLRLLRAKKVAICGASTFCTYPVLANQQALRYLYLSEKLNPWVKRVHFMDNVQVWNAPRVTNNYAGSLTDPQLMHWLRHQDPDAADVITGPPLFRVPKTRIQ